MRMIDTQILVHMNAGRRPLPIEAAVASVSVKEFLVMYGQQASRDRYYLGLRLGMHAFLDSRKDAGSPPAHPTRRRNADKLIIDLNNQYPSLIEYSHLAISHYLNNRRTDTFKEAIGTLPKHDQKSIEKRIRFLIDGPFKCFALDKDSATLGLDILCTFLEDNNPKKNFLNTLRDALILGTAVKHRLLLQTEDKLLAKLAAKLFDADMHHEGADLIVDFGGSLVGERTGRSESKGYINRGWRIAVEKQRGPERA